MKTSLKLNNQEPNGSDRETYIVFGCARGGTSMIAGCMVGLGIHMGNDLPQNYEDPEFVNRPKDKMIETIKRKNQHHVKWGWKFPEAANYLDSILNAVVNPRFIIVYRDLVAIANKQNDTSNIKISTSFIHNILQQNKNTYLSLQWSVPTLAVSYEKAILNKEAFLSELCEFISVDVPEDTHQLLKFMEPGIYKSTFADKYVA